MTPSKIEISDKTLIITWDDETQSIIELMKLRGNCPCAYCNKERGERSKSYIPVYFGDQLKVTEIKKVGSYALNVVWKDGHNTGIYEFNKLKNIAT